MRCLLVISMTACLYSGQTVPAVRHPRQPLAGRSFSLVDVAIHHADNTSVLAGPRFRRQTRCRYNQWGCRDGYCINVDEQCDGKVNCPDGSDETHAECDNQRLLLKWGY